MDSLVQADCTILKRNAWSWSACIANDSQELQALVVSFRCKQVLLKKEADTWVLPGCLYSRANFASVFEPEAIIPQVQDLIGKDLPLIFLRQLWRRVRPVIIEHCRLECEKVVVLLALADETLTSEGVGDALADDFRCATSGGKFRWISAAEAKVSHLIHEAATAIEEELKYVATDFQPHNRVSWQRPGWFEVAKSWMIEQLSTRCNASLTDDIIQLRSSHLGIILEAETTTGSFFLKCTSAVANDASFTRTLASLSPSLVKAPVAVEAERQLLLTADYGAILNPWNLCPEEKRRLTSNYAHLQMDTIGNEVELISAGFPDMRVNKLLDYVDELDACSMFHSLSSFDKRSETDVSFFRNNKQTIKTELSKLNCSPKLEATITHNDLFSSNVYWNEDLGNYMFFDFVESYVSHPFAFQIGVLDEKHYLEEWSARTGAKIPELEKLLSPGYKCHLLAVLVMRLHEAQRIEFPESERSLEEACCALRLFNGSMRCT